MFKELFGTEASLEWWFGIILTLSSVLGVVGAWFYKSKKKLGSSIINLLEDGDINNKSFIGSTIQKNNDDISNLKIRCLKIEIDSARSELLSECATASLRYYNTLAEIELERSRLVELRDKYEKITQEAKAKYPNLGLGNGGALHSANSTLDYLRRIIEKYYERRFDDNEKRNDNETRHFDS